MHAKTKVNRPLGNIIETNESTGFGVAGWRIFKIE